MKNPKIEHLNLQILLEINKNLSVQNESNLVLNTIMDFAIELTQAERGFLILEREGSLEYKVARTLKKEPIPDPEHEISRSIIHTVLTQKTSLIATDAKEQKQFEHSVSVNDLQLRSVICLPLIQENQALGVIYLDNRQEKEVFSTIDLDLLVAFGHLSGIALSRALLYEQLRKKTQELEHSKYRLESLNKELQLMNQKLEAKWKADGKLLNDAQHFIRKQNPQHYPEIIAVSPSMLKVLHLLDKVIHLQVPVLIYGETGTGKELISKVIHKYGPRKDDPFLAENCAGNQISLLESELFGYEQGAFTGAQKTTIGLFESATKGTLLLDGVSEMSGEMQKKLLRVLQEGKIRRVGGQEEIPIDVRIISASSKDLQQMMELGEFREDLYYRLNVINIYLPPLRERREDIYLLANKFLENYANQTNTPIKKLEKSALALLENYSWPGNIRELENVIYSLSAVTDKETLSAHDFSSKLPQTTSETTKFSTKSINGILPISLQEYLTQFLLYHQEKYTDSELAKKLGISRKTLWDKRKKLGIHRPASTPS
ncbi:MAG: sigma-54-dependent Fis family transcriptional regulator [Planctomycetota bacterium]